MPLPTSTVLAAAVKARWESNDPAGFGSLSSSDKAAIVDGLVEALCYEVLEAVKAGTVSVNGSTASSCTAGGSAGTCTASGSMT